MGCGRDVVFRYAVKVSSSFAEAASSRRDGEATFDVKLSDLEQNLKTAEKQLLQSQVSRIGGRVGSSTCRHRLSYEKNVAFRWRVHSRLVPVQHPCSVVRRCAVRFSERKGVFFMLCSVVCDKTSNCCAHEPKP